MHEIWKMANDGSGKTKITEAGATGDIVELSVGSDNRIYHTRWVELVWEIFSMNKDGSNLLQFTTTTNISIPSNRRFAKYWQGKIYYQGSDGIYVLTTSGSQPVRIISAPVHTFDISVSGEVIYSRFELNGAVKDEQRGTLWVTNSDGGNKQQLTFNRF